MTLTRTTTRGQGPVTGSEVLFLGDSLPLCETCAEAEQQGFLPADTPHANLLCAIIDEDLLDGLCTPSQAESLQQARILGVRCLAPREAHAYLSGTPDEHSHP